MNKTILIAFFSSLIFTACAQSNDTESREKSVNKTEVVAKRVSKEEFKNFIAAYPRIQLVDVRTPKEYQAGTIGNAANIDFLADNFEESIAKLDKETPTFIFCRSGGRSSRALKVFEKNGFTTVYELEGGYLGW